MSTELPQITQTLVDSVFQALVKMEVDLDENPLDYGPRRLNMKTAETRKKLAECEHLFLRISGWMQKCRSAHRAAETELELEKKHLFANDPEVRAGRNVSTQDALASMKLRSQVEELSKIKTISEDLEAMLAVIKSKRNDLKDVQRRLGDQIRLCQEEIGLGGKWGSRVFGKTPDLDAAPNPDHKSLKDLREMFAGVDSVKPEDVGQALIASELEGDQPEAPLVDTELLSEDSPEPLEEAVEAPEVVAEPAAPSSSPAVSVGVSTLLGEGSTDAESDGFLATLEANASKPKKSESDIDDLLRDFDLDLDS